MKLDPEKLLTVAQFAKRFGISRPTAYKFVKENGLKIVWVAGRKLILVNDLLLNLEKERQ